MELSLSAVTWALTESNSAVQVDQLKRATHEQAENKGNWLNH